MDNLTHTRPERPAAAVTTRRRDSAVVVIAGAFAALLWLGAKAAGIDLEVHSGAGAHPVGLVSAIVTSVVVAVVADGLLRVLERRTPNGLRVWTIAAVSVWVLSFLGPLSATTAGAGLVLATMHLAVGAVVVVGLRRTRVA